MHADDSPDLRIVGKILRDVFEVCIYSLYHNTCPSFTESETSSISLFFYLVQRKL